METADAWINCPHCGLKHRPRAQTLCPRCGRTSTVSRASVVALPTVAPSLPAPPRRTSPVTPSPEPIPTVEYIPSLGPAPAAESAPATGPKTQEASSGTNVLPLAGGILLVNAVLHLFEFLFLPSVSTDASLRAAQLAGTLLGVGVDVLLGVSFLRGRSHYRTLAFIRLVVGMFLFGGMSLYQAQYLFTLVVFSFSCGVLVLVSGKPSAYLAGVGLTAVLLGVAVELIGFTRLAATQPLMDRARIALRPDLEGRRLLEDEAIVGDRHPYKLRVPSHGWYRRKAEVARTSDSTIDVWLVQPDATGHLLVSVRDWNEATAVDVREARDSELKKLRMRYPDFQVTDTSDNGTRREEASVASLSGSADRNGEPHQFEVSLYKVNGTLLLVTAFAPTQVFETLHLRGSTGGLRTN